MCYSRIVRGDFGKGYLGEADIFMGFGFASR